MQDAKISVIIPLHNQGKFLEETLESIFTQILRLEVSPRKFEEIAPVHEVIVTDDLSTDDSYAIAQELQKKYPSIIVQQNEVNLRVAKTRNKMFKQTTGTHIICLDADDILEQNYFFETLQTMKEKDADIVYTDMHLFGMVDMKKVYPQYSLLAIRSGNICHVSSLMKRTVYEQTGGFAEDFRKGNEDYAMWLTAAKLGFKFAKCSKTGLNYRRHLESNIVSGDFHKNRKIMYEDLKKRFGDFYLGRP